MRLRIAYFLLTLWMTVTATAQTEQADRLLTLFNGSKSLQTANMFFDLLHKEEITDEHIKLSATTNPDTVCQQVWYWAAEYYLSNQNYQKGKYYGKKALPLYQKGNNRVGEGDCLACIAICHLRMGEFDDAIVYARKCNDLDMQAGDPDNISSSLNMLAAIYVSARQYDEAEQCILKALEYSKRANNPKRLAILTGMACDIYNNKGQYDKGLSYGQEALHMEQQLGRPDKIAVRQSQIAEALIGQNRYDEARQLVTEALPELRKTNPHSQGIACNQMGRILLAENKNEEAAKYFNEALEIFVAQKDIFNESRSQKGLYEALRDISPEEAMRHNDRYNQLRDSLYDTNTGLIANRYAADTEQLQAENERLHHNLWQNIIIIVSAILLLSFVTWIYGLHKRRQQEAHIEELTRDIERLTQQKTIQQKTETENITFEEVNKDLANDEQFLMTVINSVQQGLPDKQMSVEEIAQLTGMTTNAFRQRLQQLTGETPKSYITAILMQKAVNLLTTTNMSVNDVARACGYTEQSNFSRTFKRIYGVTPSQYVK